MASSSARARVACQVLRCDQQELVLGVERTFCGRQCACARMAMLGRVNNTLVLPAKPELHPGQKVQMSVATRQLNYAALVAYLLPILGLISGAVVTETWLGLGVDASILGAGLGLFAALLLARLWARKIPITLEFEHE